MIMLRGMFGILMTLLNSSRPVTRAQLARKLEISERTVSSYIDAMSADCGVPVTVTYGMNGGYSLSDNYKLNQTFFTVEEYERILTCLSAVGKELDDEITTAVRDKFEHLHANAEGEKFLVKSERFVIDSTAWLNPSSYRNTIAALNKAIDSSLSVRLSYVDKRDSHTERMFDPYTLVLKEGVWYVYGWCHVREDFRLFKLSRIRELNISSESFERKESDVYEKLGEEFIDREKVNIVIECDESALPAVEEWLGIDSVKPSADKGKFIAEGYAYSEDLLIKKLLTFGSHVRVLSPSYVVEELRVELSRTARMYE